MYNNWFSAETLQKELKRIEDEDEEDVVAHLEGLDIEYDEEEISPNKVVDGNYLYQHNASAWKRREGTEWKVNAEDFVFQHMDTTQGMHNRNEPTIHLWGCTVEGASVAVIVRGFRPYFYARIATDQDAQFVRGRIEALLNNGRSDGPQHVIRMERVYKLSMCGWSENRRPEPMQKLIMRDCSGISRARKALDYANRFVVLSNVPIQTFEANVPFELRYMVDHKMGGCQWIRLKASLFKQNTGMHKLTHAAYEFVVEDSRPASPASNLISIECIPVKERRDVAPIRKLSFDIECKKRMVFDTETGKWRRAAGFVDPKYDPVVCICMVLEEEGRGIVHKAILAYVERAGQGVTMHELKEGELKPDIFVFNDEREMLLAFRQYVVEADIDLFTGWNIVKFDLPYVFNRAITLGVGDEFSEMTRMMMKKAKIREHVIQSKAWGAKKEYELICEGRFVYDGLAFMERGQLTKYRSYKLNSIAKVLLGDQKVDVDYTQIAPLHEGSDTDRGRLCYYCLKDAELPLRILNNRMATVNGVAQARVMGVPMRWVLAGQGRKTFSNILRYKRPEEVVPTRSPKINNVYTAGGFVRKPIAGHYPTPIFTQDFASLYPSIIQAENVCYSTVLSAKRAKELIAMGAILAPPSAAPEYQRPCTVDDFNWPPGFENEFCFVKPHIRLGVLPDMLTALLAERAYVKGLMKSVDKTKDKQLADVYDNWQLAVKVGCNSVYGFLKAFILVDPRLMSAVTAWGQFMIKKTADIVVTHYKDNMIVNRKECERLGLDWQRVYKEGEHDPRPRMPYTPRIIYGDTDSIMVDFGDIGLQDGIRYQKEAAALCTKAMKYPNKLEPESVKLHAVYIAPKMYASMEIMTADVTPDDTLESALERAKLSTKGLQHKRRDNAPIGSETQGVILKSILKKGDIQGALDHVKQVISDLLMDRVDLSKLVISKGLSKTDAEYKKTGAQLLHTKLKERIAARAKDTGEIVPETGDRVPFIMRAKAKHEKACDCSEDPLFAQKNRVPIDKDYYIYNQVWSAVCRVFTAVREPHRLPDIKSSMSDKQKRTLWVYEQLFAPSLPHMLQKKERKIGGEMGIEGALVALPQCLYPGCGVRLEAFSAAAGSAGGRQPVCREHDAFEAKSLLEQRREDLERVAKAAWDRCRACAGGGFDEVTCANTSCDNFFHRDRAVMDVEDLDKDLALFKKVEFASSAAEGRGRSAAGGGGGNEKRPREEEKAVPPPRPAAGGEGPKRLKDGNISKFFSSKNQHHTKK